METLEVMEREEVVEGVLSAALDMLQRDVVHRSQSYTETVLQS